MKQPGLQRAVLRLECANLGFGLQRHADIVESVHQAVFAMGFDVEAQRRPVRADDRLLGRSTVSA